MNMFHFSLSSTDIIALWEKLAQKCWLLESGTGIVSGLYIQTLVKLWDTGHVTGQVPDIAKLVLEKCLTSSKVSVRGAWILLQFNLTCYDCQIHVYMFLLYLFKCVSLCQLFKYQVLYIFLEFVLLNSWLKLLLSLHERVGRCSPIAGK